MADAYGVWGEQRYGELTIVGNERSTFVIDENGLVKKILRRVDPDEHAADVLATLEE